MSDKLLIYSSLTDGQAFELKGENMLSFIWWLIIGVIVGALARLIMPGKDTMSWLATLLLGVAGSILGGLVSWAIWGTDETGFRPAGFLFSLIGAILLLWVWRAVKSRSTI